MAANPSGIPNSSQIALDVLRVTRGNLRSLGPAGALNALDASSPYVVWLAKVERAIAALEQAEVVR
jgi:hypothetical protein